MSSPEWYQIRSADHNSNSLRYTELLNKININQFSANNIEDIKKPKILAETTNSVVGYQDPFYLARSHGLAIQHLLPTEPNAARMKSWLRFAYIDAEIKDLAMMENHGILEGYPILCPGYDDGVIGLFLASKFNSEPTRLDYAHIAFNPSINISNFSTGFSFSIMFRPLSFAQHNGIDQHLVELLAENNGDEWGALRYSPDGKLKWFTNDEGVTFDHITSANRVLNRAFYLATCTYDPLATPKQKLFLNGVDIADVGTETPDFPTDMDDDLHIGISSRKDAGACNAVIQDFRMHSGAITLAEHQNLWANMRSIDSIFFGLYAVPGYWWIPDLPIDSNDFNSPDFNPGDFLT